MLAMSVIVLFELLLNIQHLLLAHFDEVYAGERLPQVLLDQVLHPPVLVAELVQEYPAVIFLALARPVATMDIS